MPSVECSIRNDVSLVELSVHVKSSWLMETVRAASEAGAMGARGKVVELATLVGADQSAMLTA
jgi:hypothetical protein